jgi:hypothetical protein
MACVLICALFVAGIATAQSKVKNPAAEPKTFYEDCGDDRPCLFDNPAAIPNDVLDALWTSKEVQSEQDESKNLNRETFAQYFKAIVIHLSDPKETDYVLLSESPLGGADAPWFWIVRFDHAHPKVIFFTFANGFEILKTRNNGYPDIRSYAFTANTSYTEIYHYDGQKYVLVHRYHKENTPGP